MNIFHQHEILAKLEKSGNSYLEFLKVKDLSVGIYKLPPDAKDLQQPHTEDEVYYVIGGKGMFALNENNFQVKGGTVLYVPAHVPHYFHSIEEELTILVFFAPAEGTNKVSPLQ